MFDRRKMNQLINRHQNTPTGTPPASAAAASSTGGREVLRVRLTFGDQAIGKPIRIPRPPP